MNKDKPLVSIIVPNYNHAPYLQKRFASINDQNFIDYEVIVLDDASTDHSNDIIEQYERRQSVRVIRNVSNSGNTFKQWNLGIRHATGQYIWIAESDDYCKHDMLAKLVGVLNKNCQVGIVYCQSYLVNTANEILGSHLDNLSSISKYRWNHDFVISGREMLEKYMISINAIPNASAALFRKSAYDQIGGAVEDMKLCGDWMTWSKILLHHHIAFIAEPLNYYRIHDLTVRKSFRSKPEYLSEYFKVIKFIQSHIRLGSKQKRETFKQVLKRWLKVCLISNYSIQQKHIKTVFRDTNQIFGKSLALLFTLIGIIAISFNTMTRNKENV